MPPIRNEKLDALGKALVAAEIKLYELNFGVSATARMQDANGSWSGWQLGWLKHDGTWKLVVATEHVNGPLNTPKPLLEASVELKKSAAHALPALLGALRLAASEEGKELDAAIKAAEDFVQRVW